MSDFDQIFSSDMNSAPTASPPSKRPDIVPSLALTNLRVPTATPNSSSDSEQFVRGVESPNVKKSRQAVQQQPSSDRGSSVNSFVLVDNPTSTPEVEKSTPVAFNGYVTFVVAKHVVGVEAVKPITYFPISVAAQPYNISQEAASPPKVLTSPLHTKIPLSSQKLCKWEQGTSNIERRYSELVDFRTLLVLLYPMLCVPPLPPKTTLESFSTMMQDEGLLKLQQRSISRFLKELSKLREVMLFNELVPLFFQLPREPFLLLLDKVRACINHLKEANLSVEEYRQKLNPTAPSAVGNGGSVSASTIAQSIAGGTTKAMKNLVTWFGGGGGAQPTNNLQVAIQSTLEKTPSYTRWDVLVPYWVHLRGALSCSSNDFLKFIAEEERAQVLYDDIRKDFVNVAAVLHDCSLCHSLKVDFLQVAEFTEKISTSHLRETDRRYVRVVEILQYECYWIDAILDAVEFSKALVARVVELQMDRSRGGEASAMDKFVKGVVERLATEVEVHMKHQRFERLSNLLKNDARMMLNYLSQEEEATKGTVLVQRLQQNAFVFTENLPPVNAVGTNSKEE